MEGDFFGRTVDGDLRFGDRLVAGVLDERRFGVQVGRVVARKPRQEVERAVVLVVAVDVAFVAVLLDDAAVAVALPVEGVEVVGDRPGERGVLGVGVRHIRILVVVLSRGVLIVFGRRSVEALAARPVLGSFFEGVAGEAGNGDGVALAARVLLDHPCHRVAAVERRRVGAEAVEVVGLVRGGHADVDDGRVVAVRIGDDASLGRIGEVLIAALTRHGVLSVRSVRRVRGRQLLAALFGEEHVVEGETEVGEVLRKAIDADGDLRVDAVILAVRLVEFDVFAAGEVFVARIGVEGEGVVPNIRQRFGFFDKVCGKIDDTAGRGPRLDVLGRDVEDVGLAVGSHLVVQVAEIRGRIRVGREADLDRLPFFERALLDELLRILFRPSFAGGLVDRLIIVAAEHGNRDGGTRTAAACKTDRGTANHDC